MQIIAVLIATAIPLAVLYLIYRMDLYKTGAFRMVVVCFVAGGAAFFGASLTNRLLIQSGVIGRMTVIQFTAPILEEVLKALILVYMVRHKNFNYFVDGAIYGFAAGIGFAVFENYEYIFTSKSALNVAVGRVISTNLVHAAATSLVGIAFGLSRFSRSYRRVLLCMAGLAGGMVLHVIFNNVVTRLKIGAILLCAAAIGIGVAVAIVFLIKQGLKEEKGWIKETLGAADRVTANEAAVVNRLEKVRELLAPVAQRFGPKKAEQIEKFLVMQAQLGIKRKMLEKLPDEKMRQAVMVQMDELRQQMDQARREVGAYCMVYVRQIFPQDESNPLWGRLDMLIQERVAERPAGVPVNNVWAKLEKKSTAGQAASSSDEAVSKNAASALPWGGKSRESSKNDDAH